ncbi:hypothetical protein K9L67_03685 [Candidatus Woesearchaeota archaeon]|nr:hypothetical protein [Candidatus Woesearchaeota archaeon]MCF7901303.1 hypothetical protein [Candidatus Woesearchaeota archaeon]MCF8013791.1 hypothetical protein [Candidatus Woesearchaeota archaeon]
MKQKSNSKINKKGELFDSIPKIFGMLLVLGVIFLVIFYWNDVWDTFTGQSDTLLENADYDGDGILNGAIGVGDKCPCGTDNVLREDGPKSYCVLNEEKPICLTKYKPFGFEWFAIDEGIERCYYQKKDCLDFILAETKEIRAQEQLEKDKKK